MTTDVYEWFDPAVEMELGRRGRERASELFHRLEAVANGDMSVAKLREIQLGPLVKKDEQ